MSWIACQIQTTSTGHHRSSQIVEKVVNADTRPKFVNSNHSFVSTVWSEEIKRIECRQFGVITIISAIHLSFWFFNFGSFPVSRFRIFICFFFVSSFACIESVSHPEFIWILPAKCTHMIFSWKFAIVCDMVTCEFRALHTHIHTQSYRIPPFRRRLLSCNRFYSASATRGLYAGPRTTHCNSSFTLLCIHVRVDQSK